MVELRPGADLAVDYAPAQRRVVLRSGGAHFTVAKEAGRPFVVHAGGVEIGAVGTAFAVELDAREVGVLVTEGRVSVARPAAAADRAAPAPEPAPVLLGANQRVSVPRLPEAPAAIGAAIGVPAAEVAERLAWRSVRLEFSDTPLLEAVNLMNRHASGANRLRFVVRDAELARLPITGLFRADNGETFARLLEASAGLAAERTGDTIVLRRAGSRRP